MDLPNLSDFSIIWSITWISLYNGLYYSTLKVGVEDKNETSGHLNPNLRSVNSDLNAWSHRRRWGASGWCGHLACRPAERSPRAGPWCMSRTEMGPGRPFPWSKKTSMVQGSQGTCARCFSQSASPVYIWKLMNSQHDYQPWLREDNNFIFFSQPDDITVYF